MAVPHVQEWKWDERRPTRWKMQSTIPVVASTKMMPQEPEKAKSSIQTIAFGGDQSQLAT